MVKLIIFDWDDVIMLGARNGYFKCYHETMVDLGINLDPEEERKRILAKWSKSQREELGELLQEKPNLVEKANKIYESKLFGDTFTKELRIIEGTIELLRDLNSRYRLCVATSANPRLLKEVVMPKFKIPQVFSQIFFSSTIDDLSKQKPHPYMVEEIMKTQKIGRQETILVGDASVDISMAHSAGVTSVAVLTGCLSREEAENIKAKFIIKDVTHLPSVLAEMGSWI